MTRQQNLFDRRAARESASEAIERTDRNAQREFRRLAYRAGEYLASREAEFDSAMLRDLLREKYPEVRTHDDRALGAIMRQLSRDGVIERTDRTRKSGRKRNHNRDLRVWRSLRFGRRE